MQCAVIEYFTSSTTECFDVHSSNLPADWVAVVTGDDISFKREGGVSGMFFLWRAGAAVTGGGQREVMTFTGHITGVTADRVRDNRQDRGLHWI